MFLSYLFDRRNRDIPFEVVSSSVIKKVFTQFATIYRVLNVASMVAEPYIAFSSLFPIYIYIYIFFF